MNLGLAVTRIAQYLAATIANPPGHIGGTAPVSRTELPALVLSISDATEVPSGVGNVPRPPQRRPLAVTSTISLSDPVIHFPDGDVPLLSDGGRVLRLPHGALVHADGAPPPPPLGAADLRLTLDGTDLVMVTGTPGPRQFRLDTVAAQALGYGEPATAGVVRFAAPLVGATVVARYFVGEYELTTSRYRGQLSIDVVAIDAAAVDTLSAAVGEALRPGVSATLGTAYALTPTSWGPVAPPEPGLGNARRRTLTFRFDLELEQVRLPSGGGKIARVDVETSLDFSQLPLPTDKDFSIASRREESP